MVMVVHNMVPAVVMMAPLKLMRTTMAWLLKHVDLVSIELCTFVLSNL
jgi:hypothetical protein